MSPETQPDRLPDEVLKPYLDRGHQGDVDRTLIAGQLRLTPTERVRRNEEWRLVIRKYAGKLLRGNR